MIIYHPDAKSFFLDSQTYINWFLTHKSLPISSAKAGIICYYNQLIEGHTAEIDSLIRTLEKYHILPICVFSENLADTSIAPEKRYVWHSYPRKAWE
ncbi:MAG: hypothetical protein OMM_11143 [Candidatus Magnetoglobus multicellularis str. Araruama]|uniref:CobN/magnesium chelatase domain-containing protein n=1 Tax=Candidatus Magnetoglobus multicellularis str. Araruama TaxID=890399 RepID=A0A1V1NZ63_9BACT|nr:MAG: hypothetical protein OMM_11143 [Candidatus Magnetoglobus multicellularis str. Araruama]